MNKSTAFNRIYCNYHCKVNENSSSEGNRLQAHCTSPGRYHTNIRDKSDLRRPPSSFAASLA